VARNEVTMTSRPRRAPPVRSPTWSAPVCRVGCLRCTGTVDVVRDRVAVGDHAGIEQRRLGLSTGESETGGNVHENEVVVRPAGDEPNPSAQQTVGECPGVVHDPAA